MGKRPTPTWVAKVNEPVITDRSVDLVFVAYWLCFTWWGVASLIAGVPTIQNSTTAVYELWWGGSITGLSFIAALAAASTFISTTDVKKRARRKTIEMSAVLMLTGFLFVYPMLLIVAAAQGDQGRVAIVALGFQYLLFPAWRARHLFKRIRALRELHVPTEEGAT
ncbi:hypothetical protein Q9R08_05250 [Microbacterium sp. QXD-8]|uniref:Uncharacterized protein n=1 Tax=Microbacterium psychrotolerans TaxID=3068321 RepID=A0ABU0Z011_9MICO|nr:hypothetical protein [Microbacterium sp. QXD-8]MDQ7877380.1 hypothetical protein [Microbacterium sp. QXD-8]